MGILTNPKTREKIVGVIAKYNNKLCVLCYVAGLTWFLALAYSPLNAKTYFSENALLPGLVEAGFNHDFGAGGMYEELKVEVTRRKEISKQNPDDPQGYRIPATFIEKKLRDLGLETHVQNFSFRYPVEVLKGQRFEGQNVYGILRAPRAASTEAIVISTPYRPPESNLDKTNAGIGLMTALAKAFRKHTYWAKDIIFLVTEHEQIGMQAWLSAYHYETNDYILPGDLTGKSGSIQAALNLEISTDQISRMNLKLEGLNGQLPNLDLVNTIVRLCKRESIAPTLQKRMDPATAQTKEGFEHALRTMLGMMWNQATGMSTGNHGLFHRYHIEAVTLQSVKMKGGKRLAGYTQMGRVVEGVVRSLNNLLERFHQSFFFYLLPETSRYVSIGLYMPPFGLLVAPILIKAVALWIGYGVKCAEDEEKAEKKTEGEDSAPIDETTPEEKDTTNEESKSSDKDTAEEKSSEWGAVMSLLPVCLMASFFGLGAFFGPKYFIISAEAFRMKPHEGLGLGAIAIHVAAVMFPKMLIRKANQKGASFDPDWQLLKCMCLLTLGVVLAGTGLMNISLAFFIAVVWVPIVLMVRPTNKRMFRWLQYILMLMVSPLALLCIASVAHCTFIEKLPDYGLSSGKFWESAQTALLMGVLDQQFFGMWTYSVVSLTILPVWLLLWSLLWTQPY